MWLFIEREPQQDAEETLLKQLESGLPSEALGLLELPLDIYRGEVLQLWQAGICTPGAVWATSHDKLAELLGDVLAELLIDAKANLP